MTQIDQFESVFRAAAHDTFAYEAVAFPRVLFVTDADTARSQSFIRHTLDYAANLSTAKVELVPGEEFRTTTELLDKVAAHQPDLICTYRNLHSRAWQYQHSLGEHLDVLLQRTAAPVLVMPHPEAGFANADVLREIKIVMAMTDQLANNHALVNHAVSFAATYGELYLTHIEDKAVFERYINAISKIPSIDTDEARERIAHQLLQDPFHYTTSCREVLEAQGLSLKIRPLVSFGHHLPEYRQAVESHAVNLLVMNTKDNEQLAMHGLAYPLAVELRQLPLLML
ncbi:MAG: hypothetical protein Q3M24_09445 [Candidatus Electrothrix aestuarii]|uniref:Uncharacterized protein n=1 Tax=Candidatus Electrothrix aestuarii TaxID=3062594 RepID=A0AAU8M158_9BACT|nr:hypothetical protein [Candidatus Electrothrix aestuarii]